MRWLWVWLMLLSAGVALAGSAQLSWVAPTQNVDDSPLTDLAGYLVYQGTSAGMYGVPRDVGLVTQLTIDDLDPGYTYYFVVSAYDTHGNEGPVTPERSKTIPLPPPSDQTPPTVQITAPAPGSVRAGSYVLISTHGQDATGVTSTKVWINGHQQCVASGDVQGCRWRVPTTRGAIYQLTAAAWDAAGNQGRSPVVSVTAR